MFKKQGRSTSCGSVTGLDDFFNGRGWKGFFQEEVKEDDLKFGHLKKLGFFLDRLTDSGS